MIGCSAIGFLDGVDVEGQTDCSEGNAPLALLLVAMAAAATTNGHSEGDVAARQTAGGIVLIAKLWVDDELDGGSHPRRMPLHPRRLCTPSNLRVVSRWWWCLVMDCLTMARGLIGSVFGLDDAAVRMAFDGYSWSDHLVGDGERADGSRRN